MKYDREGQQVPPVVAHRRTRSYHLFARRDRVSPRVIALTIHSPSIDTRWSETVKTLRTVPLDVSAHQKIMLMHTPASFLISVDCPQVLQESISMKSYRRWYHGSPVSKVKICSMRFFSFGRSPRIPTCFIR